MKKKVIRKPLAKLEPAGDQTEAAVPGNAGNPKAPIHNAHPGGKKKTGMAGWMMKKKMLKTVS